MEERDLVAACPGKPVRPSPDAARELVESLDDPELMLDDGDALMGATDCRQGCVVEPDGACPHGYEAAALTAGLI
jgi:hypothetical protein